MNEIIVVLFLAVVQGIAEWLPVSSSGHLVLASHFLGFEMTILFSLALHFGTLMAVFVYFGKDITEILRDLLLGKFKTPAGKLGIMLIIAALPIGIVGFLLHDLVSATFDNFLLLAFGLLITSLILFIGSFDTEKIKFAQTPYFSSRESKLNFRGAQELRTRSGIYSGVLDIERHSKITPLIALLIGLAQIASLFRGISRSGSTIVTGMLSGLSEKEAVKFSFLLSIPVILSANLYELGNQTLPPSYLWASLAAFGVGLLSIHFSFTYVLSSRKNLRWLAAYVFLLAVAVGIYLLL